MRSLSLLVLAATFLAPAFQASDQPTSQPADQPGASDQWRFPRKCTTHKPEAPSGNVLDSAEHLAERDSLDLLLSTKLAQSYSCSIVEQAKQAGKGLSRPELLEFFVELNIERSLAACELVAALLQEPSPDPKARLLSMLAGVGSFAVLPPRVRRFIAKTAWAAQNHAGPKIGSLASFMASYSAEFDSFKDSLVDIDPEVIAECHPMIPIQGTTSKHSEEGQEGRRSSVAPPLCANGPLSLTCSLLKEILSSPSLPKVVQAEQPAQISLGTVLQHMGLPPSMLASGWSTQMPTRPALAPAQRSFRYHLFFCRAFLRKYDISDADRSLLLRPCTAKDLLTPLLSDVTDLSAPLLSSLDFQALVRWSNSNLDPSTLSWPDAVTLYCLDEDQNALRKYAQPLKSDSWMRFAEVALGVGRARYLGHSKRVTLLSHLDPQKLAKVGAVGDGCDQKALVVKIVSLLGYFEAIDIVDGLSDSDFSLWVEACLEDPETCKLSWHNIRRHNLAVRALLGHIGSSTDKAAKLERLPENYQTMVALLAECDAVADLLGKALRGADLLHLLRHHSGLRLSQAEAERLEDRLRKHHPLWLAQGQQ